MASPIYTTGDPVWNSLENNTRVPVTSELESGWPCGEVDQELLNFVSGHGWNLIHNMLTLSGLTPIIPNLHQLAQAVQTGKVNYAEAAGTANAVTATLSPAPASLVSIIGAPIRLKMSAANTASSVTLDINGFGAVAIRDVGETTLPAYAWADDEVVEVVYDGTYWRRLNYLPRSGGTMRAPNAAKILIDMIMAAGQTEPPIRLRDNAGNVRLTYDLTFGGLRAPNGLGSITTSVMLLAGATGSGHFTVTDGNRRQQVQSDYYTAGGVGDTSLVFPISFKAGSTPNVIVTAVGDGLPDANSLPFFAKNVSATGFTCAKRFANNGGGVGAASQNFFWTAIGEV